MKTKALPMPPDFGTQYLRWWNAGLTRDDIAALCHVNKNVVTRWRQEAGITVRRGTRSRLGWIDRRARERGYRDAAAAIIDNAHLGRGAVAQMLGVVPSSVGRIVRRCGLMVHWPRSQQRRKTVCTAVRLFEMWQ